MSDRAASRMGPASGIVALVLSLGGFALIGAAGFALQPGASTEDVADAIADGNRGLALAGIYLDTLGSLFLVVFAAYLAAVLQRGEGIDGWLARASFGAALLMVAAGLGDKAAYHAIVSGADDDLDAAVAATLYDTVAGFFTLFQALAGLFALVTGFAIVRTGALRRWLGWSGVGIGLASILAAADREGDVVPPVFPLVFLWIVALSISLLRSPTATRSA